MNLTEGHVLAAEFLCHLEGRGIRIGLEQRLRLHTLFQRVGDALRSPEVKSLLIPILATSAAEQATLSQAFDEFVSGPADRKKDHSSSRSPRAWNWRWPVRAFLLAIAVTILVTISVWAWREPAPKTDTIALPPKEPRSVLDSSRAPIVAETNAVHQAAVSEEDSSVRMARIGLALVLLVALCAEIDQLIRRRVRLRRERRRTPPYSFEPTVARQAISTFAGQQFRHVARRLRQRHDTGTARLDLERSLHATFAAGGYPSLRFTSDRQAPEYLILIERLGFRDHQAAMIAEITKALIKEGVHIEWFYFDSDPRVCYSERNEGRKLLAELSQRFPNHRLLLFAESSALIEPVTGKLLDWVAGYFPWRNRVLLTPHDTDSWGMREITLGDHFPVMPATISALGRVSDLFDGVELSTVARRRIVSGVGAITDDTHDVERLKHWMGDEAFGWLCACALYPELHWDLTVQLGGHNAIGKTLLREEHLRKLVRLTWFRHGMLPDDLRLALMKVIDPSIERAARLAILTMLEQSKAVSGSFAARNRELNISVQRLALGRGSGAPWRTSVLQFRKLASRAVLHDQTIAQVLESRIVSPLTFALPARMRRLFFRSGLSVLGVRPGVRLGFALAAAMALLVVMQLPARRNALLAQNDVRPLNSTTPGCSVWQFLRMQCTGHTTNKDRVPDKEPPAFAFAPSDTGGGTDPSSGRVATVPLDTSDTRPTISPRDSQSAQSSGASTPANPPPRTGAAQQDSNRNGSLLRTVLFRTRPPGAIVRLISSTGKIYEPVAGTPTVFSVPPDVYAWEVTMTGYVADRSGPLSSVDLLSRTADTMQLTLMLAGDREQRMNKANAAFASNRCVEAIDFYQSLERPSEMGGVVGRTWLESRMRMAQCQRSLRRFEPAIATYQLILDVEAFQWAARYEMAGTYCERNDFKTGIETFREMEGVYINRVGSDRRLAVQSLARYGRAICNYRDYSSQLIPDNHPELRDPAIRLFEEFIYTADALLKTEVPQDVKTLLTHALGDARTKRAELRSP